MVRCASCLEAEQSRREQLEKEVQGARVNSEEVRRECLDTASVMRQVSDEMIRMKERGVEVGSMLSGRVSELEERLRERESEVVAERELSKQLRDELGAMKAALEQQAADAAENKKLLAEMAAEKARLEAAADAERVRLEAAAV